MPVLKNARHERFAQEIAKGKTATEAYELAGYAPNDGNAARLKGNERILARLAEIQGSVTQQVVDKLAITEERIMREYARIGFADLRNVVDWVGELVTEQDNPDGGDVLVIKNIHSNHVKLISAKDLDEDAAAAISEISQGRDGVKIKLHPKLPALDAMAEYTGIKKPQKIEHSGPDGAPIEMTVTEAGRRIAFALQRAARAPKPETDKGSGT